MGFDFVCDSCGKRLTVPPGLYEKRVRGRVVNIACKVCGAAIRVDGTLPPPPVSELAPRNPTSEAAPQSDSLAIPGAPRLPDVLPRTSPRPPPLPVPESDDSFADGWDPPSSEPAASSAPFGGGAPAQPTSEPPPAQGRHSRLKSEPPSTSRPPGAVGFRSPPPLPLQDSGPPGFSATPSSEPTRFDGSRPSPQSDLPRRPGFPPGMELVPGRKDTLAGAARGSAPPPSEPPGEVGAFSHVTGPISVRAPIAKIGRYQLFDKFASGGMATVHLGRLDGAGGFSRVVAIKRLLPHLVQSGEFSEMLLNEARLAARVRHPNVVPTLDVVASKGEVLLVLEYVHGEALSALCRSLARKRGSVPIGVAVSIILGLLQGLHAVHEATDERGRSLGLVHRDVSPQNVMVGADGMARVLDFGIVKALQQIEETMPNRLKGKTGYMSPEQIRGERLTRASDIFAAGIVLWELLTLRRFSAAATDKERIEKILSGDYARAVSHRLDLPQSLDEVVMRALSFDPSARFPTAREFAEALAASAESASTGLVADWVHGLAEKTLLERERLVAQVENWDDGTPEIELSSSPFAVEAAAFELEEVSGTDPSQRPPRTDPGRTPAPAGASTQRTSRTSFLPPAAREAAKSALNRLPPEPSSRLGLLIGGACVLLLLLYFLLR
jgi:serine/threonine protein kinase